MTLYFLSFKPHYSPYKLENNTESLNNKLYTSILLNLLFPF